MSHDIGNGLIHSSEGHLTAIQWSTYRVVALLFTNLIYWFFSNGLFFMSVVCECDSFSLYVERWKTLRLYWWCFALVWMPIASIPQNINLYMIYTFLFFVIKHSSDFLFLDPFVVFLTYNKNEETCLVSMNVRRYFLHVRFAIVCNVAVYICLSSVSVLSKLRGTTG